LFESFSCSTNEKLDVIPEGELKPKSHARRSAQPTSPIKKRFSDTDINTVKLLIYIYLLRTLILGI